MTIKKSGGGKYTLVSKKTGRNLSKPGSLAAAKKRERQVEHFKRRKPTKGAY